MLAIKIAALVVVGAILFNLQLVLKPKPWIEIVIGGVFFDVCFLAFIDDVYPSWSMIDVLVIITFGPAIYGLSWLKYRVMFPKSRD